MKILLSGSRVYGTPRADSDLDVVILAPAKSKDEALLRSATVLHESSKEYDGANAQSRTAGDLNVILVRADWLFDAWVRATDRCLSEAPCSRDRAIEIHTEERARKPVRA